MQFTQTNVSTRAKENMYARYPQSIEVKYVYKNGNVTTEDILTKRDGLFDKIKFKKEDDLETIIVIFPNRNQSMFSVN